MKKIGILLCLITEIVIVFAQRVGIGTTAPNASALLDANSTTKGVLLPRMTTAQRNAILTPVQGLPVLDTKKATLNLYDGDQLIEIKPDDVTENDAFGKSVAAGDDYIVVGAPGKTIGANDNQGAVYVITPTSPVAFLQQKLTASDGAANDYLGTTVSTTTNFIGAGAPGRTVKNKLSHGAGYVFAKNAGVWSQQQKIIPGDGDAENYFGNAVGIGGGFILIGAPGKDSNKGGICFSGL